VLNDTFIEREGVELNLIGDASVNIGKRQVAGSWHLFEKPTEKRRVVGHLNTRSMHTHTDMSLRYATLH